MEMSTIIPIWKGVKHAKWIHRRYYIGKCEEYPKAVKDKVRKNTMMQLLENKLSFLDKNMIQNADYLREKNKLSKLCIVKENPHMMSKPKSTYKNIPKILIVCLVNTAWNSNRSLLSSIDLTVV